MMVPKQLANTMELRRARSVPAIGAVAMMVIEASCCAILRRGAISGQEDASSMPGWQERATFLSRSAYRPQPQSYKRAGVFICLPAGNRQDADRIRGNQTGRAPSRTVGGEIRDGWTPIVPTSVIQDFRH